MSVRPALQPRTRTTFSLDPCGGRVNPSPLDILHSERRYRHQSPENGHLTITQDSVSGEAFRGCSNTDGSGTEEGGNAQAWRFALKKQNADDSARRTHTEHTASHRLPWEPRWGRQATGWRWVAWAPSRRPGDSHAGEAHVRLHHTEVCRWQADTLDCYGGDHWKGAGGQLKPGTLYKIIQKTEENDRSSQLLT